MDGNELREPFERLMARAPDWAEIAASGFLDALVAEDAGGAGLTLAQVFPLVHLLGRVACQMPVAETMVARALLAEAGMAWPEGPIALGTSIQPSPFVGAEFLLHDDGGALALSPSDGGLKPSGSLRPIAAVLASAEIAGAAERMLEMSIAHANDRVQFGKPIGKNQVLQQMLAVMGELVLTTRMASQMGFASGLHPTAERAAVAKQVTSAAIQQLTSTAHALHGAMGITEEFGLHPLVTLLYSRRMAHGSESYWARVLGEARLSGPEQSSVDFVRGV
jgi:acyl-CoA dehydrogenase